MRKVILEYVQKRISGLENIEFRHVKYVIYELFTLCTKEEQEILKYQPFFRNWLHGILRRCNYLELEKIYYDLKYYLGEEYDKMYVPYMKNHFDFILDEHIDVKIHFQKIISNEKEQSIYASKVLFEKIKTLYKNKEAPLWIRDFLQALLYDLETYALTNNKLPQITRVSKGFYSSVYQIGDQILKIGKIRHHNPNIAAKSILHPSLYKEIDGVCTIEVSDLVEIPKEKGKQEELNDIVYQNLKEEGIYWLDCALRDNTGLLLKENLPRYTKLNDLGYKFLGIPKEVYPPLPSGSPVLIDRDYYYTKEEYDNINEKEASIDGFMKSCVEELEKESQKKLTK